MNKIIKKHKWKTCSFDEAKLLLSNFIDDFTKENYGFTIKIKRKYYICYDSTLPKPIQKFTIAHEIGHIILKHFNNSNHLNDEKEANMFAARLLMPICILYECKVKSILEIQKMCEVSEIAAQYRYKRLKLVMSRDKFYTDKLELKVKKQFQNYIQFYINKK